VAEDRLQRKQRIKLRKTLCLALQKGQHRAGERVTQGMERSGHIHALARFIEDRADATRWEWAAVIGEKQRCLGFASLAKTCSERAFLADIRTSSINRRERRIDVARLCALGSL
jgi:IS30 family transposase